MDLFAKIETNKGHIGDHAHFADGYFTFPKLEGEIATHMTFRGKKMLTWSLNNYLGLANHPEVRKADADAAAQYGMGYPMGARMMSGQTAEHEKLEQQLADFVGKESAFLLNFGYQGMVSIIQSLVGRYDVIVYDAESHACILDGMMLTSAKRFVFAHNDMESLKKMLAKAESYLDKSKGGILVITEGVFGMGGDLGKLDEIVALKRQYDFRLLVDDAHGFGTMGATGSGTPEHFGVIDEVDVLFDTFAKSMAGIGAFVAGSKELIFYLRYTMRSQTFAKSLPMPMVLGAQKRLELLKGCPELKENLWKIVRSLQTGLKKEGFNLGKTQSPVTPVYLSGVVLEAVNVVFDLRENYNLFCSVVAYPVVPKGQVLLRLIPTAVHTLEDVNFTIETFKKMREKLKGGYYEKERLMYNPQEAAT